jgi:hypothetical protein
MRSRPFHPFAAALALTGGLLAAAPASQAAEPATLTQADAITGTVTIDFGTRTQLDTSGQALPGTPAPGAKDVYTLDLTVLGTTALRGTLERQPWLMNPATGRALQPASLRFDLALAASDPAKPGETRAVAKWTGTVPVDDDGVYLLEGGKEAGGGLRVVAGEAGGAEHPFTGRLAGKPPVKNWFLPRPRTFTRMVEGREVSVQVRGTDPMELKEVVLPAGAVGDDPRALVSGRLELDYTGGSWFTDGLRLRHAADGAEVEDVVRGSIRWVPDPERKENGKGRYEVNLRFNEARQGLAVQGPGAPGANAGAEAFFAPDPAVPSLTGTLELTDTLAPDGRVATSQVVYRLNANHLTRAQVLSLFKLWVLAVAPSNDD